MKSLNRSLPRSSHPPEDLLRAFKSAALSVTTLYKEAAGGYSQARQAGYQDALDDLLSFLDKENLGLGDGEGWNVRQWATERLDGGPLNSTIGESEDERETRIARSRDIPPSPQPTDRPDPSPTRHRSENASSSPSRTLESTSAAPPVQQSAATPERRDTFTFQSNHPYPTDIEMPPQEVSSEVSPTLRFEMHPRSTRHQHRYNSKQSSRGATAKVFGLSNSSKRKLPDFFDISGLGEVREGGTKRGRTA